MLSVNFIGCGHLGKTIGRLIIKHDLGTVKGVITTSLASAKLAVAFIGAGRSYTHLSDLPYADVYFIVTPDDIIENTCKQLIEEAPMNKGTAIIHCSGALTSGILQKAKDAGCYIINVHPIKSFANPDFCIENFEGTYCTFEGDSELIPLIRHLFGGFKAMLLPIEKEQKIAYHAAAVIASTYLVGLHYTALKCYQLAGFDEAIAGKIVSRLMGDALQNIQDRDHLNALCGPLPRGDIGVIKKHLSTLVDQPLLKAVYRIMGQATMPITNHSHEFKALLDELFQNDKKS